MDTASGLARKICSECVKRTEGAVTPVDHPAWGGQKAGQKNKKQPFEGLLLLHLPCEPVDS
jgi:hypothetical protein